MANILSDVIASYYSTNSLGNVFSSSISFVKSGDESCAELKKKLAEYEKERDEIKQAGVEAELQAMESGNFNGANCCVEFLGETKVKRFYELFGLITQLQEKIKTLEANGDCNDDPNHPDGADKSSKTSKRATSEKQSKTEAGAKQSGSTQTTTRPDSYTTLQDFNQQRMDEVRRRMNEQPSMRGITQEEIIAQRQRTQIELVQREQSAAKYLSAPINGPIAVVGAIYAVLGLLGFGATATAATTSGAATTTTTGAATTTGVVTTGTVAVKQVAVSAAFTQFLSSSATWATRPETLALIAKLQKVNAGAVKLPAKEFTALLVALAAAFKEEQAAPLTDGRTPANRVTASRVTYKAFGTWKVDGNGLRYLADRYILVGPKGQKAVWSGKTDLYWYFKKPDNRLNLMSGYDAANGYTVLGVDTWKLPDGSEIVITPGDLPQSMTIENFKIARFYTQDDTNKIYTMMYIPVDKDGVLTKAAPVVQQTGLFDTLNLTLTGQQKP